MQEDVVQMEREKRIDDVKFSSPTIWKNPRGSKECYFGINKVQGFTIKTKNKIVYNAVESVTAPVVIEQTDCDIDRIINSEKSVQYEEFKCLGDTSEDDTISGPEYAPTNEKSMIPSLTSQMELSDLFGDLGLPKDGLELLASFLKKKNLLEPKIKLPFYRNGDSEFRKYFVKDEESTLVYRPKMGLMDNMRILLFAWTTVRFY